MTFYYWFCVTCRQSGARREAEDRDEAVIVHAARYNETGRCCECGGEHDGGCPEIVIFSREGEYQRIDPTMDSLERIILVGCSKPVRVLLMLGDFEIDRLCKDCVDKAKEGDYHD